MLDPPSICTTPLPWGTRTREQQASAAGLKKLRLHVAPRAQPGGAQTQAHQTADIPGFSVGK